MSLWQDIITIVGAICTTSIFIAIIIDYFNQKATPENKSRSLDKPGWKSGLKFVTNTAMLSYLLHSASITLIFWFISNNAFCTWTHRINTAIYHTTRCAFYAVLIARVHTSFQHSVYKYNTKLIIIPLFAVVIAWFIFAMIGDLFIEGVSGHYDDKASSCEVTFALYGLIMSGIIDIILSIVSLILFIRPLIKLSQIETSYQEHDCIQTIPKTKSITISSNAIENHDDEIIEVRSQSPSLKPYRSVAGIRIDPSNALEVGHSCSIGESIDVSSAEEIEQNIKIQDINKNMEQQNQKNKNDKKRTRNRDKSLDELIARYALLVTIAVVSSFIVHITAVWTSKLSPIDDAINVWCIILINKANNNLYHKICFSCDRMTRKCCKI